MEQQVKREASHSMMANQMGIPNRPFGHPSHQVGIPVSVVTSNQERSVIVNTVPGENNPQFHQGLVPAGKRIASDANDTYFTRLSIRYIASTIKHAMLYSSDTFLLFYHTTLARFPPWLITDVEDRLAVD